MNRIANAFATALPSADLTSHRESPRPASPFEPSSRHSERRWDSPAELYDDPRSPYDQPSASSSRNVSLPGRPGLVRSATDDGSSRALDTARRGLGLLRPGEREHSRSRSRTPRRDRSVRAVLLGGRPKSAGVGGAKLTGLAKGSDGRYAVGGGQSLKIIQLNLDGHGSTPGAGNKAPTVIGRGDGGSSVSEVVNLWKGSWGPQKGVVDLDWGTAAMSNKVVTASPSGNWLLFDVERGRLEKEVTGGHPRPLNCVKLCPLPTHGHLLLTGGVEGQVKVWDLRERDPGVKKYFKHSVAVTSICFSPTEAHHFLVGLEQGVINRYDMRNHSKAVGRVYGAHGTKAVMDLKWKAEDGDSWLASSGADRTIQVWDMNQGWHDHPSPIHSIHTANPIRRLAWRSGHTTEIAAAPMSQYLDVPAADTDGTAQRPGGLPTADADAYVRIWDVRRHHIAKYALPTPDGGAIDVGWEDDGALVACFQEGVFLVQDMSNHVLPIDVIRRQVVGWNIRGEIAYAVDKFKQGEVPFDDVKQEHVGAWRKLGRKEKSIRDAPYVPLQNIGTLPMHTFDEEEWIYLSNHYRMQGDVPENLCRWNAEVAEVCGRDDDARLWIFLKHLIEEFAPCAQGQAFDEGIFSSSIPAQDRLGTPPDISPNMSPAFQPQRTISLDRSRRALRTPSPVPLERLLPTDGSTSRHKQPRDSSARSDSASSDEDATPGLWTSRRGSRGFMAFQPADERRISEVQSRFSGSRRPSLAPFPAASRDEEDNKHSSASSLSGGYPDPYGVDAALGKVQQSISTLPPRRPNDTKGSIATIRGGSIDRGSNSSSDPLSRLRRPTAQNSGFPPHLNPIDSGESATASDGVAQVSRTVGVMKGRQGRYSPAEWEQYRKDRCKPLRDLWTAVVDDGDIQLSTCIAVVGSVVMTFPPKQVERIAHAYVDMLDRHRLSIAASVVRLHAGIASLETSGADQGVVHIVHCDRCGRTTGGLDLEESEEGAGKRVWWCRRCKRDAKTCSICHDGVRGIWFGCNRCKHGGHHRCMRMYYLQAPVIPAAEIGSADGPGSHAESAAAQGPLGSSVNLTNAPGTSHGSPTNWPGHSALTAARHAAENGEGSAVRRGWNECPKGCGCMCRSIVGDLEVHG